MVEDVVPALEHLAAALEDQARRTADVVKAGRTHLMDATPVMLGQEFGGYAAQVRRGVERVQAALPRVAEVPLGGTAVGTGINTPPGFSARVVAELARSTGLPVTEARDHFEAQGARDALVELSGALRVVAVSLTKICNDLRWMSSGPNAGLGEIHLPDLQPGSSIMPGKVNPVICEAVLQVAAQVVGHDATIAWAGASGNFELNVMVPVMARSLLEQTRLIANGCTAAGRPRRRRHRAGRRPGAGAGGVVAVDRDAAQPRRGLRDRGEDREARGRAPGDDPRGGADAGRGRAGTAELDRLLDVSTMTRP